MSDTRIYIQKLFSGSNITVASNRNQLFDAFIADELNISTVNQIKQLQTNIMASWKLQVRIKDIQDQNASIPNATVGKAYETKIDFTKLGWDDIVSLEFEGLEAYGLTYDNNSDTIKGIPTQSGDVKIPMWFKVAGEDEHAPLNKKIISLIVNADPKSLWKDIPSDEGKDDEWRTHHYWKPDTTQDFQPLGPKHIVVSSKRGRSHANVGSFRDDDYAFKHFENTGWSVVVMSDGAGSAKAARKGSELACRMVVDYFEKTFTETLSNDFDALLTTHHQETQRKNKPAPEVTEVEASAPAANSDTVEPTLSEAIPAEEAAIDTTDKVAEKPVIAEKIESTGSKISKFIYHHVGNAANTVHHGLGEFAKENGLTIKDLHSTLIFALYKKYDFGYVVLSFGVGDCPIGLLNKDLTEFKLMNWLDVGEFGGGTRFITMPEIFTSEKFPTRFGFKILEDFSYLMLMTDGIYDPKFVVEANLEKLEKWKEFLADLGGNNEDKLHVEFNPDNTEIANQLSSWMDFWSAGNHDDRTLAIVF